MSWDRAHGLLEATVASYFDTVAFTARPMRKSGPNGDYESDGSRRGFCFKGSLDIGPELTPATGSMQPKPTDRNIRLVSRVCLTALASGWPWLPRQGDRIAVADTIYQVAAAPERDGSERVVIWLNRIVG